MSKARGKNIVGGNIEHVGGHVVIGDGVTIIQGDPALAPIDYLRDLPPLPADLSFPPEPYVGLRWFTRAEALIFFGRGDKIKTLHDRLTEPQSPPVTLLYGQSGVGKSSLLHAGLLPRLESRYAVHYLRRDYAHGIGAQVAEVLEAAGREGPPLLIILDQLEELLTQPHPARPTEAVDMAERIATTSEVRWLLSFRKEYLAELTELLRGVAVAPRFVYLEPLQSRHIIEAVEGVSRGAAARKVYGLTLEPGVAEAIAHDIARDQDSHIAPALQVLMTKLWRVATGTVEDDSSLRRVVGLLREKGLPPSRSQPRLTMAHYRAAIAESGLLMDEFLGEQLRLVGEAHPAAARHGLLLSLLYYFTTELGTARSQTRTELLADFGHIPELPRLLAALQDRYLLTDQGGEDAEAGLRLAHDALGPLVRQRFQQSTAIGPRARNVLETRSANSDPAEPAPLDKYDLAVVGAGQPYMRKWNVAEARLVERSRARRRRFVGLRNTVLGLLAILFIAIGYFGYRNYRLLQARTAQLMEDRADGLADDPTAQFLAYFASQQQGATEVDRTKKMYAVYRNNPMREVLLDDPDIYTAALSDSGRQVILFKQRGERYWAERHLFDPADRSLRLVHELADVLSAEQSAVALSDDGRLIVAGGADHRLHVWDEQGRARPTDTLPDDWNIELLALRETAREVLVGFFNRREVQRWNLDSGRPLAEYVLPQPPTALFALPEEESFLAGFADGTIGHYGADGQLLAQPEIEIEGSVSALAWDPEARILFVGSGRGEVHYYWFGDTGFDSVRREESAAPGGAVRLLRFDPRSRTLLFGGYGLPGGVSGFSDEKFQYRFHGVDAPAAALAFEPEANGVLAVYARGGISFWRLPARPQSDNWESEDLERVAWAGPDDPATCFLATYGRNLLIRTPGSSEPASFGGESHQGERITALTTGADRVVTGDVFGRVLFHDRRTGAPVGRPIPGHRETIRALYLTPDGQYALSASTDTRLVRWDARSGDTLATIWRDPFTATALSPSSDRVAVSTPKNSLVLLSGPGWERRAPSITVPSTQAIAFLAEDRLLLGGENGYGVWSVAGDSLFWIASTLPVTRIVGNRAPDDGAPAAALVRGGHTVWLLDSRGFAYQEIVTSSPIKDVELVGTKLWIVSERGQGGWRVDRPLPEDFATELLR